MGTLTRRLVCSLLAWMSLTVPHVVSACVLPVFVDATGETAEAWWTPGARGGGPLQAALAGASSAWCAAAGEPEALSGVSALLRVIDITPNNAAQLGAFVGAERVAVGRVTRVAAPDVAWLGLHRTVFVLQGAVLDAASGSEIRPLELRAVAFGQTALQADEAAYALLGTFAGQTVDDVTAVATGRWPSQTGEPRLIVTGGPSAAPYVAARAVLRDASPGVVDLVEDWATEGAVGVRVALDEDAAFAAYAAAVRRLAGTTVGGVRVDSVTVLDTGDVQIEVSPPAPAACDGCSVVPAQ